MKDLGSAQGQAASRPGRRDPVVDALRGVALFGILVVNLPFFAMPYGFAGSWWRQHDALHLGTATAFLIQALFENKFILIFSFLFGMGAASQIASAGRGRFVMRMVLMALLGMLNAAFVFEADILLPYAVIGLLLLPVQSWSSRNVLVLAAMLWAVAIVSHALFAVHAATVAPAPGLGLADRITLFKTGSFAAIAGQRLQDWATFSRVTVTLIMPMTAAAFCFGILAWRERRTFPLAGGGDWMIPAARALFWPAVLGNVAYASLCLAPSDWAGGHTFLAALVLRPIFAPLLSLVILAHLLRALASVRAEGLRALFAASGRMSLTIYVLQGVAGSLIFFGYGLGLFAGFGLAEVFALSLILFLLLAALAALWGARLGAGPLEFAMSRLLGLAAAAPPLRAAESRPGD